MIAVRPLWLACLLIVPSAARPQQIVQSGYVDVDGARLYYEQAGTGLPVVLIHGGFLDHRMWDGQFALVAGQYRAIRYDVRAHGRSQSDSVPFADYEDLRRLMDALEVPRAVIVGLSMGGAIAIDFALANPDRVAGLVLVGAGVSGFEPRSDEILEYLQEIRAAARTGFPAVFETFAHWWCDGPYREPADVDPAVRGRVLEMLQGSEQRWKYSPLERSLAPPAIGRLREIDTPTLAVVGTLDVPDIDQLAHLIDQEVPGAERVYVEDVAHMVNMEKPAEFNAIVMDFLARMREESGERDVAPASAPGGGPLRITVLFDNTVADSRLTPAWGFAALIEHGGRTLLFDAGGDPRLLLANADSLGIDLRRVDAVAVSHAHGDHTNGLQGLVQRGVRVPLYALPEFASAVRNRFGDAFTVREAAPGDELLPGVFTTGTMEDPGVGIPEQSLVIPTDSGLVVITGCAHQGIVAIVRRAMELRGGPVRLVVGGFHLGTKSDAEVRAIIAELRHLGVRSVGATHCTGEEAIAAFAAAYGADFVPVGVGRVLAVGG
jgi:metal-dependent hydrolase (beta-lactamase superfamily II)/pimeloyl-ACP methyl ester carboxylesterase